jgi:hypothetical protein
MPLPQLTRTGKILSLVVLAWLTSACGTLPVAAGDGESGEPAGTIWGDYKWRFNSPVNVYLRKVDDRSLSSFEYSAKVLPGEHELLVDCGVGKSNNPSRYIIKVKTEPGVSYRLKAVLASGNRECSGVELVEAQR